MQSILRIKQGRSISRVVVLKTVAPIGLVLPARCFAALCMTGLYFIIIPKQFYMSIISVAQDFMLEN